MIKRSVKRRFWALASVETPGFLHRCFPNCFGRTLRFEDDDDEKEDIYDDEEEEDADVYEGDDNRSES